MFESIINPKNEERGPIKLLFVGLIYGSLSILLVLWLGSIDAVIEKYAGMVVVTFCVIFSLPYMYYLIRQEEDEDEEAEGLVSLWKVHSDAMWAFMFLFIGFVIAFSFWHIILSDYNLMNAQVTSYCYINSPGNVDACVQKYTTITGGVTSTGSVIGGSTARLLAIFGNNVGVMLLTLILSLVFGAGAIFILAWNASVIAAAIGIVSGYRLIEMPMAVWRFAPHGFFEILAYFITAMAGGMFGVGFLRNGIMSKNFLKVLENTIILLFFALIVLGISAVIEVYLTPIIT